MKHLVLAVLLLGVSLGSSADEDDVDPLDELLAKSPQALAKEAAEHGDTRFMSVPACDQNEIPGKPYEFPTPPFWKNAERREALSCDAALGRVTQERLRKLKSFAETYNDTMFEHISAGGLYPVYPEDAESNHELTPAQTKLANAKSAAALKDFYGSAYPDLVRVDAPTAWTTWEGEITRLFIESRVQQPDLAKVFQADKWKDIPMPLEFAKAAHSIAPAAIGIIDGRPSYLFITPMGGSELAIMMVLVLDAGAQQTIPADVPASRSRR